MLDRILPSLAGNDYRGHRDGLVYLVVLLRYRALIPLMYLLLLPEYLGRAAISALKPILTMETLPGARFGAVMIVLSFAGLVLSLR
jgi:hypothetical protein